MTDKVSRLASRLGELLLVENKQVTAAESCTGGGIAEAITRIAGSSAWFEAGYVTYSNRQKTLMLQVPEALFARHGAVSEDVVKAMVQGACQHAGAWYGVAVSGIAGPGGATPGKPVGTVCFAWAAGEQILTKTLQFGGDRVTVRRKTVEQALAGLILLVERGASE